MYGPVSKQGRETCQLRFSPGIHEHTNIHVHLHTHGHVHACKREKNPVSARLGVGCHAASSDSQRSRWSPGEPSKATQDCPPPPTLCLRMEEVGHLGLPRRESAPLVKEGTDDLGSDRVELQVRDIIEVLLAVFRDVQERKSQENSH